MAINLEKEAKARGIQYFLISYVDLFGVMRAKLVPARAIARNGAGVNPDLMVSLSKPISGDVWRVGIDLTGTGALFSTLNVGLGGAVDGPVFGLGQLLILPPYLDPLVTATNEHAFPMPPAANLLGLTFSLQGFLFIPGGSQLLNGIEFTIGTY